MSRTSHAVKISRKPFYKRIWFWIVIFVALVAIGGISSLVSPNSQKTTVASPPTPTKTAFNTSELTGKTWDAALTTLSDHKWTEADYTIQTDDGKKPFDAGKWTVISVSNDKKPVISLRHDIDPAIKQKDLLEKKLSTTAALTACQQRGKHEYPYGFKTHDIGGVIQDFTPRDDNTWYYKATVDVTNAYGATAAGRNYECTVTGTTDNPQVVGFNVY